MTEREPGPDPAAATIAAIATAPGRGGIGVIRVSGPGAVRVAGPVIGRLPPPRVATLATFLDASGAPLDRGLVLYFPGPASFTGEDVVELHAHGGPVLLDLLLAALVAAGARLAQPGEFSQRAFLNDKLDLAQAEAVADLIDAASAQAARAAAASLEGAFSAAVRELAAGILRLRAHVEATLDFPDEEIDVMADVAVAQSLDELRGRIARLRSRAHQGTLLREGLRLVITGRPNVGKSSLLNAFAGRDAAIVTAVPGTTRDVLREAIDLDGLPVHVVDTAGLREARDEVERIGVERARDAVRGADCILLVTDRDPPGTDEDRRLLAGLPEGVPCLLVRNKIDLAPRPGGVDTAAPLPVAHVSARTGDGLPDLRAHLQGLLGFHAAGEGSFTARRRHLEALAAAAAHLDTARELLHAGTAPELLAEELHLGHDHLGTITGRVHSDALLGEIFATFCIGK